MEFEFLNKKLEKLYITGKSSKYKIEHRIKLSFFEVLAIIDSAEDIYDLWEQPSLNFEKYKTWYSLRVTGKWRLEVEIDWLNEEKTIGRFRIKELDNHYGD